MRTRGAAGQRAPSRQMDVSHGGRQVSVAGVQGDLVDGPVGAGQIGQPQVPEGVGGQSCDTGPVGDAFDGL